MYSLIDNVEIVQNRRTTSVAVRRKVSTDLEQFVKNKILVGFFNSVFEFLHLVLAKCANFSTSRGIGFFRFLSISFVIRLQKLVDAFWVAKSCKRIDVATCIRRNKVLILPAVVQTTVGFISEAKVSTSSGINWSTNFLHSSAITSRGMRAQEPSKTCINSL